MRKTMQPDSNEHCNVPNLKKVEVTAQWLKSEAEEEDEEDQQKTTLPLHPQ